MMIYSSHFLSSHLRNLLSLRYIQACRISSLNVASANIIDAPSNNGRHAIKPTVSKLENKIIKDESFVFRAFFGEIDKDCLKFNGQFSNIQNSLSQKQFNFVRENFMNLISDETKLKESGFYDLFSFTTLEQSYLFEAIGASLNYRKDQLSSSSNQIVKKDQLQLTTYFLDSYENNKSFLQFIIPFINNNGIIIPTIQYSFNPAINKDSNLNHLKIGLAFDESENSVLSVTYPYWNSTAIFNSDLNSWILNGEKSQIFKSEYDKFLIFCKVKMNNGNKASDYSIGTFLVDKDLLNIEDDGSDSYGNEYLKISFNNLILSQDMELSCIEKPSTDSWRSVLNIKANAQLLTSSINLGILKQSLENLLKLYRSDKDITAKHLVEHQITEINKMIYSLESMIYMTASSFDSFDIKHGDNFLQSWIVKTFSLEISFKILKIYRFLLDRQKFSNVVPHDIYDVLNLLDSLLDSSSTNRLLLGVYGLQQIGKWSFNHTAKMRLNLIYMSYFLKTALLDSIGKKVAIRPENCFDDLKMLDDLHVLLKEPAASLKQVINIVYEMGKHILEIYGKDCVNKQIDVNRFASLVMCAFQMMTVISRTQMSLKSNNSFADKDVMLCKQICKEACQEAISLKELIEGVLDTSEEKRSHQINKRNIRFGGYFTKPTFDRLV